MQTTLATVFARPMLARRAQLAIAATVGAGY